MVRSSTWDRRRRGVTRLGAVAGLLLVVCLMASCSATTVASVKPLGAPTSSSPPTTPPPEPSKLVLAPVGAANVTPGDDVTAQLVNGTLESVTLTGPGNKPIAGAYDSAKTIWKATPVLAYNAAYTLTASGSGADGQHHTATRKFTTARARAFASAQLWSYDWVPIASGGTYGVGQIIVVRFDRTISDRPAAERNLMVASVPAVVGAWRWMDSSTVHFRPREYWPAGTTITLTAKIQGRSLGGGVFGRANRSVSFAIGRSKIAIADSSTHYMKVYLDGVQVPTVNGKDVTIGIPVSLGKNITASTPPPAGWTSARPAAHMSSSAKTGRTG